MNKSTLTAIAALVFGIGCSAKAADLITNGDFETGDFTGWNASVFSGSYGSIQVLPNGSAAPISGFATQTNSLGGNYVVLTGQSGGGAYSLTQTFTVSPGAANVIVSFQLFANDYAGVIIENGLNPFASATATEWATADILAGGADPFSTSPSDIVANLYHGADNLSNNPNAWTSYSSDLGALAAGTYQVRFAEADNQNYFTLGVDNVSVAETVGVPDQGSSIVMLAISLIGLAAVYRRKAIAV